MPLPYGFSAWDAQDILDDPRPPWRVENEDEVRLAFKRREQPRLTCVYCGSRCDEHTRDSVDKAVRWFHNHDCRTLEQAEAEALVLSLRPFPHGTSLGSQRKAA